MNEDLEEIKCGVAVIGSGFAGLAAARFAARAGLEPLLVSAGGGASAHFSGAFDVLDPRAAAGAEFPETSWDEILSDFVRRRPGHAYAELCPDAAAAREALSSCREVLEFYGVPHVGDGISPVAVFGSSGAVKPAAFALPSHGLVKGERGRLFGSKALAVGVPGLADYPAEAACLRLGRFFKASAVSWPFARVNRTSPLASIAAAFDAGEDAARELAAYLKGRLSGAAAVFLPPFLGARRWESNRKIIETETGARVVEFLSNTPSFSGLRFGAAADATLVQRGIPRFSGRVTGFEVENGMVTALVAASAAVPGAASPVRIRPRGVILATGKFLGGGIVHRGSLREALFDLPLFCEGRPLSAQTHVTQLLGARGSARQPLFSAGLVVDAAGRVLRSGIPVYRNLRACGHVLAGFDFTRDRCGFGLSVMSAGRCFAGHFDA